MFFACFQLLELSCELLLTTGIEILACTYLRLVDGWNLWISDVKFMMDYGVVFWLLLLWSAICVVTRNLCYCAKGHSCTCSSIIAYLPFTFSLYLCNCSRTKFHLSTCFRFYDERMKLELGRMPLTCFPRPSLVTGYIIISLMVNENNLVHYHTDFEVHNKSFYLFTLFYT